MRIKVSKLDVIYLNTKLSEINVCNYIDDDILYVPNYITQVCYKYHSKDYNFVGILFLYKDKWTINLIKKLLKKFKLERVF